MHSSCPERVPKCTLLLGFRMAKTCCKGNVKIAVSLLCKQRIMAERHASSPALGVPLAEGLDSLGGASPASTFCSRHHMVSLDAMRQSRLTQSRGSVMIQ